MAAGCAGRGQGLGHRQAQGPPSAQHPAAGGGPGSPSRQLQSQAQPPTFLELRKGKRQSAAGGDTGTPNLTAVTPLGTAERAPHQQQGRHCPARPLGTAVSCPQEEAGRAEVAWPATQATGVLWATRGMGVSPHTAALGRATGRGRGGGESWSQTLRKRLGTGHYGAAKVRTEMKGRAPTGAPHAGLPSAAGTRRWCLHPPSPAGPGCLSH